MSSTGNAQSSQHVPIKIEAQLDATHNSTFPFSSPMIDDSKSLRSIRTGNTALSHNPFQSLNSSTTTLTDCESGATSEQDTWHLERYSETYKAGSAQKVSRSTPSATPSSRASGLQIITDFSKPSYHVNNLVIDHVQAHQAQTRANRARSIISQKGVKVGLTDGRPAKRGSALLSVKGIVQNKRQKRKAVLHTKVDSNQTSQKIERAQSQKSIVIGLCISQNEALSLEQHAEPESAVTLNTPVTPAIILTPPDAHFVSPSPPQNRLVPAVKGTNPRPASSVYSMITCSREYDGEDDDVPPLPTLPLFAKGYPVRAQEYNQPILQNVTSNSSQDAVPSLACGTEHTIEICDTPRSQGWWNLLLSPMLSRTGSFTSKRGFEGEQSPPPVPDIPEGIDKALILTTPNTNASPETPRRLGLACTPTGTWSTWTEWEKQLSSVGKTTASNDADNVGLRSSELPGKIFPSKEPNVETMEGLAAEYYHACAVEQLTSVQYFECINHSCSQHLPRLVTTNAHAPKSSTEKAEDTEPQAQTKKLVMLGSPFRDNKGPYSAIDSPSKRRISEDDDDASITDIESDDEPLQALHDTKRALPKNNGEIMTPVGSDTEPDELSPNIREANTAAFVKAKARGIPEATKTLNQSKGSTSKPMPNLAALITEETSVEPKASSVPDASTRARAIPAPSIKSIEKPVPALPPPSVPSTPFLSEMGHQHPNPAKPQLLSQQFFMNPKGGFSGLPASPAAVLVSKSQPRRKSPSVHSDRNSSFDVERKETLHTKAGNTRRGGRGWYPSLKALFQRQRNGSNKSQTDKKKKRKRRLALCICILLLLIVILCIVLATTITRRGDGTPVTSRWLNLTGYPPMPIGISTVAQPDLAQSQSGCVQPATLWSCALPKDDQQRTTSNGSSTPDFRFEIKYRNGTTPANMNIPLMRRANDPFTNDLFTSNPVPPNDADQLFLGNTTDNITAPFDGEPTPFYITFMSTFPVIPSAFNASTTKSLTTRQTNLGINIPAPDALPDGSAVPVSLLPTDPFPTSQPIRLYNRGHEDEHYGFYIYYDKSVFLTGISILGGNATVADAASTQADDDGGATKPTAKVRCTWQQTRFLVKIFTNPQFGGSKFAGSPNVTLDTSEESEYSSATDFARPGSFPYATSITIDRHGGNINNKIAYCYAMDKGKVNEDERVLVFEDRAAGGILINGAPSFVNGADRGSFDEAAGGIDGGTGGCSCTWQNWR